MNKFLKLIINNSSKELRYENFFEKDELKIILDLYAQMVSKGQWKDYGLNISKQQVSFMVFKNSAESAMYKISKNFSPSNRNLKYLIMDKSGKVLKNSNNLQNLLSNINWKKLNK